MMSAYSKREMLGVVEIPDVMPFEEMAIRLGSVMGGITFLETARFDEVPAFLAEDAHSGATFIFFGIPEGEAGKVYILEFSAETDLTIQKFRKITPGFVSDFLAEKDINSRGYFDYSDELANALKMKGIVASRAVP